MKVKISYSLELDGLPSHTSYLMKDLKSRLTKAGTDVGDIARSVAEREFSISKISEHISNVRMELADVDAMLDDLTNILVGYEQALISPAPSEPPIREAQEDEQ